MCGRRRCFCFFLLAWAEASADFAGFWTFNPEQPIAVIAVNAMTVMNQLRCMI